MLRIKLVPRTRAKVFGLPRRVEKPAASTTIRTSGLRRGYHAHMKNEHARLQRGPFLMPIWLLGMTALAGALVMMFAGWVWLTADSTTIIVIRHAEQVQDGGKDPPLTPAGNARAQLLARLFGDARLPGHIDAIYVLPDSRCRQTAAPLADRLGIAPSVVSDGDSRSFARRIFREHAGGRILVGGSRRHRAGPDRRAERRQGYSADRRR